MGHQSNVATATLTILACMGPASPAQRPALLAPGGSEQTDPAGVAAPTQGPELLPAQPDLQLVPIDDSEDEASYVRTIADRAGAMVDKAAQTDDPVDRADLLLAAANLILAFELEPSCTRRLLGMPAGGRSGTPAGATGVEPASPPDEASAVSGRRPTAELLDRAASLIAQADATLVAIESLEAELADQLNQRRQRVRVLLAFAGAIRAYLLDDQRGEEGPGLRGASSKLAPILEDADTKVAAAARFWQACLRALEDDPTAALARLEPVLVDPGRSTNPYGFFARLLRCRLLARRGHPAGALSLLLQIEERCNDDWFDRPERAAALRTVALVRTQILRDWHGRLATDTHADERKWCRDRIEQLIDLRLAGDSVTVLRLTPAVPIVAVAPAPVPAEPPTPQHPPSENAPDPE